MRSHSEATLVHPERGQLLAFGQGKLPEAAAAAVEQHVAECALCCDSLKNVRDDTLVELARAVAQNTPRPLRTPPPPQGTDPWVAHTQPTKVRLQLEEIPLELRDHPRYRIVERLGEGGMGVVYKAEHRMMERIVALKVISLDFTSHPTAVERFRQEVRAAAKLSHANIVTAHDAEQAGDLHFLVMEYVEGVSLARLVEKKGPLPPAQAALFARQVAQGLHHAHTHGMIHRDIKPHNLMVTRKGLVKILDFGLARFGNHTRTNLTKAEMIVGTPDYMAPEQARDSRTVDTRADLYSLGCTLYFLLTGQPPFQADSAISLMFKHCEEDPIPVETFREDVPAGLLQVMQKLMAKKPNDRFATPADAAAALLPFLRPLSQSLELPGRAGAAAAAAMVAEDEVPVAELLDGSNAPTFDEVAHKKTVPQSKKLPKRRPRTKAFWQRHGGKVIAASILLLGMAGAAMAWPYLSDLSKAWLGTPAELAENRPQNTGRPAIPPGNRPPPPAVEDDPPVMSGGESEPQRQPGNDRSREQPGDDRPQPQTPVGGLGTTSSSTKRVLFLLPEELYHGDYGPTRDVLEQNGITVKTASYTKRCFAVDRDRTPEVPDFDIAAVKGADYDAIVFVGVDSGPYANPQHRAGPEARRLLQEMQADNKLITAICTGQFVLLQQGYLDGKRFARNQQLTERLQHKSQEKRAQMYLRTAQDEKVTVDGKLITASGPDAAVEFGHVLVRQLKK